MKKYFCSSDIHGFYDEYIESLNKAGFDINNQDHVLIVCGDIFDRGEKPLELYEFLKSLPKERRILIRGNHEHLLRDLVQRGFPYDNDYSNGTYDTLFAIAGLESEAKVNHDYYKEVATKNIKYGTAEYENIRLKYRNKRLQIYKGKIKEIIDWIYSNEWLNYAEIGKYIFVHGFIPYNQDITNKWGIIYPTGPKRYREDWRNATDYEWEDATWFNWRNSWQEIKEGLNKTGKTLVVGHWHTSDFWNNLSNCKPKKWNDNPIFKSDKYGLIALDACTVGSHYVNVLVLDENEMLN